MKYSTSRRLTNVAADKRCNDCSGFARRVYLTRLQLNLGVGLHSTDWRTAHVVITM